MPQGGFTPPEEVKTGVPTRREAVWGCDYIAGMTDKYAVEKFGDLFIPMAWSVK